MVYEVPTLCSGPGSKLMMRRVGPFTVVGPVGTNAYEIDFPAPDRRHRTINVNRLTPFLGTSFPPTPLPTLPTPQSLPTFGRIDSVIEIDASSTPMRYRVRWVDQPETTNSWLPAAVFQQVDPEFYASSLDLSSGANSFSAGEDVIVAGGT